MNRDQGHIQTIEKTSKRWKGMQLFGAILMCGAGFSCAAMPDAPGAAELLFVGGLGAYVWARVGAWWHHG